MNDTLEDPENSPLGLPKTRGEFSSLFRILNGLDEVLNGVPPTGNDNGLVPDERILRKGFAGNLSLGEEDEVGEAFRGECLGDIEEIIMGLEGLG